MPLDLSSGQYKVFTYEEFVAEHFNKAAARIVASFAKRSVSKDTKLALLDKQYVKWMSKCFASALTTA